MSGFLVTTSTPAFDVRLIRELLARRYLGKFFETRLQAVEILLRRIAAKELAAGAEESEQDRPGVASHKARG